MDIESLRHYCMSKKGATEGFPFFQAEVLVFKVAGKMFALLSLDNPTTVGLKCDPQYALELRERYGEAIRGYHVHSKHWNAVSLRGELPPDFIRSLVDHSYELVVAGLKKADREALEGA